MAWETERGIGFGGEADGDVGALGEVEHLDFPVVNLVEFGKREVGLTR